MEVQHTNVQSSTIFQYATIGIVVTSSRGEILAINPYGARMFGYIPNELIGRPIETLIPSRFRERHVHHRSKFVTQPQSRPMGVGVDLFGLKKDGEEFEIEISLGYSAEEDGEKKVVAFLSDITVRKQIERQLFTLNNTLEKTVEERTQELSKTLEELQKARIETESALARERELSDLKSRFITMATHEFRTPLSGIHSSLYLMRQYFESGNYEKQKTHIQRIESNVRQLNELLEDFLNVNKLEEGVIEIIPEEFDVVDFLRECLGELESLLKNGQHFHHTHTGDLIISMDKKALRHILQNLISNAIKFSDEMKPIQIQTLLTEHEFMLKVVDQGIGISKDDQKHLFDRFFRGTNATHIQGTGLGLNLISLYLEKMNGRIEVRSELGVGSSFNVIITRK